jgi:hypothetical protein
VPKGSSKAPPWCMGRPVGGSRVGSPRCGAKAGHLCRSEAFCLIAGRSMAAELTAEPGDVLTLCPTATRSRFVERAGWAAGSQARKARGTWLTPRYMCSDASVRWFSNRSAGPCSPCPHLPTRSSCEASHCSCRDSKAKADRALVIGFVRQRQCRNVLTRSAPPP